MHHLREREKQLVGDFAGILGWRAPAGYVKAQPCHPCEQLAPVLAPQQPPADLARVLWIGDRRQLPREPIRRLGSVLPGRHPVHDLGPALGAALDPPFGATLRTAFGPALLAPRQRPVDFGVIHRGPRLRPALQPRPLHRRIPASPRGPTFALLAAGTPRRHPCGRARRRREKWAPGRVNSAQRDEATMPRVFTLGRVMTPCRPMGCDIRRAARQRASRAVHGVDTAGNGGASKLHDSGRSDFLRWLAVSMAAWNRGHLAKCRSRA